MKNLIMIMACFFFVACGDKEEADTAADAAEVNDTADAGEQDGGTTDE